MTSLTEFEEEWIQEMEGSGPTCSSHSNDSMRTANNQEQEPAENLLQKGI
jgi:hypothetical protein